MFGLPSRFTVAGVSLPVGFLAGALLAVWLLGWQGCEHREQVRWQTRPVKLEPTQASEDWTPVKQDCGDGGTVTFRRPSREEATRLAKEYGLTPAELGLEPEVRTVRVDVPGEPGRTIEVPIERPLRLFQEQELARAPWGGRILPYLDEDGDLEVRQRSNPEPLAEAPMRWGGWIRASWADLELEDGTQPDPGLELAAAVTLELARWHRLYLVPFAEAGRAPGINRYVKVGVSLGFQEAPFELDRR